jgi:hypothetical protein
MAGLVRPSTPRHLKDQADIAVIRSKRALQNEALPFWSFRDAEPRGRPSQARS